MDSDLKAHLVALCGLLERSCVHYMLVGGTAVALHGYYRHSMGPMGQPAEKPDIDIWFSPTYENYYHLLLAPEALGSDVSEYRNELDPDPKKSFFKLDLGEFTLDALPKIHADIPFAQAFGRKETVLWEGVPIHYIGFDDLIEDKRRSARLKDQADIEHLKRQRGEE